MSERRIGAAEGKRAGASTPITDSEISAITDQIKQKGAVMSTTEPTDEMVKAGTSAACELRWPDGEPRLKMRRKLVRDIVTAALRAALAVAPEPSEDDREALAVVGDVLALHTRPFTRNPHTHEAWHGCGCGERYDGHRDQTMNWWQEHLAGAVLEALARRSPVSPPEDVAELLAEVERFAQGRRDFRHGYSSYDGTMNFIHRLAAALRAPVLVETVTTEDEACALDDGTIYLDRNNDVFVKVGARAFELAGYAGRLGPSWIAYPARVFRPTREEER